MFAPWQSFYQMTGGIAATLIGLLFIVVSLLAGRPRSAVMQGARLFTTPTLFNLVSVLAISAIALVPDGADSYHGVMMCGWGVASLTYLVTRTAGLRAISEPTHWSDRWCYGYAPTAIYLALTVASLAICAALPHAVALVAICLVTLLLVTIRNAWDLITWLVPGQET